MSCTILFTPKCPTDVPPQVRKAARQRATSDRIGAWRRANATRHADDVAAPTARELRRPLGDDIIRIDVFEPLALDRDRESHERARTAFGVFFIRFAVSFSPRLCR